MHKHFNDILCCKYVDVRSIICENIHNKHTVYEDTLDIITAFVYLQRYVVNLIINKQAKGFMRIPIGASTVCFTKILRLHGFKALFTTIGFKHRGNGKFIEYDDRGHNLETLKAINQEIQKIYAFLASCIENNEYLVDLFEKVCKNLQCLICKEHQAVYDCRLCNLFFCEKCIGMYHSSPDKGNLLQHFIDDKIKLISQLFGQLFKFLESFENKEKLTAFKLQGILDEVNDNAKFLYKSESGDELPVNNDESYDDDQSLIPIIKKLTNEAPISDEDFNKILSLTEKFEKRSEFLNYIVDKFKPESAVKGAETSDYSYDRFLKEFDEFHLITRNEVLRRSNKNNRSTETKTDSSDAKDSSDASDSSDEKVAAEVGLEGLCIDTTNQRALRNQREIEIEVNKFLKTVKDQIKPNKFDETSLINTLYYKIKSLTANLKEERFKENFKHTICKHFIRAWMLYKSVDVKFAHLKDVVVNEYSFERCCSYLNNTCALCSQQFNLYELISLMYCSCKICAKCFKKEYMMRIDAKINQLIEIRRFSCLACPRPDCLKSEKHVIETHFKSLSTLIRKHLTEEYFLKFTSTITRCRGIQKDPMFRWCAHCDNGFVWNKSSLKMECENCFNHTCSNCHAKWEIEHENLTCREYQSLKSISEAHANKFLVGEHLAERKILCTHCYSLHKLKDYECDNLCFTCALCKSIFCLSCSAPYKLPASCNTKRVCKDHTFHAHHQRNCEFYLRNYPVDILLKLIEDSTECFGFPKLKMTNARCKVKRVEAKMGVSFEFECNKPVYKQNDLYNGYCDTSKNTSNICSAKKIHRKHKIKHHYLRLTSNDVSSHFLMMNK